MAKTQDASNLEVNEHNSSAATRDSSQGILFQFNITYKNSGVFIWPRGPMKGETLKETHHVHPAAVLGYWDTACCNHQHSISMCRGSDQEQPRSRRSEPTPRTSHATNTCRENGRLNLQQYIAATSYKRVPPPPTPPVPQRNITAPYSVLIQRYPLRSSTKGCNAT